MSSWTSDELARIGAAEELEIASRRSDGSLRNPVTIWVVRHGDDLYARAWRGRASPWFRGVQASHEGHIQAGGIEKDVTFTDVDAADTINDALDAAYRAKYLPYAADYVEPMVSELARAATIKIIPRS